MDEKTRITDSDWYIMTFQDMMPLIYKERRMLRWLYEDKYRHGFQRYHGFAVGKCSKFFNHDMAQLAKLIRHRKEGVIEYDWRMPVVVGVL